MSNIAAFQRTAQAAALARIPLRSAYLCIACRTITDGAPKGTCRICGSTALRSVAELLLSPEERASWLDQLRGRIKERIAGVRTAADPYHVNLGC